MGTIRGADGLVAMGGYLVGTPLVQGAVSQGASSATFDAASLRGVLRPGDQFTVAGDAQTYTVATGGVVGVDTTPPDTANEVDITFTPTVVPGGGWSDNAVVSVVSTAVAQVTAFDMTAEVELLDATVMRSPARIYVAGHTGWSGTLTVLLDPQDADQLNLINAVTGQNSDSGEYALTLAAEDGEHWWGDVTFLRGSVTQNQDALVEARFDFQGRGALATDFTP